MSRTLVAYGSKHGSTKEVAAAITAGLRSAGLDVDLLSAEAAIVAGTAGYDAVVVGGSLYVGRWHADVRRFVRRHRQTLEHLPLAVFALGPRSLEPTELAGSRKQLDEALRRLEIEPLLVTVFGGVVDPATLHFPFSRMPRSDARNWEAIDVWTDDVRAMIAEHSPVVA